MNMFDLSNKRALVTGGTRGLGRGMAEALVEFGAKVVITGTSDKVTDVAKEIGAVAGIKCDFLNDQAESVYNQAKDVLGGSIDILVNNAAIQRRALCEDFPDQDWDEVLMVNLTAAFKMCKLAAKDMIPRGYGKIINVASMISFFGGYNIPAYAASKGGVAQITKSFSNAWAKYGINVNAIAPGYMATDMNEALIADKARNTKILDRIPAGRWGTPKDVKGITVFLASSASDYINGAIIPVDGGYLSA